MRVLGFSKHWSKLNNHTFTAFRFPRRDKDWFIGEYVHIVCKPRSKERELLGIAKIVNKEQRDLYRVGVTELEAIADGFKGIEQMGEWLDKTYGRRWLNEPMNKLTLKRNLPIDK